MLINLTEARRGPKKESTWTEIEKYVDDPEVYITFVNVDKAGIYPSSEFLGTPLGLYAYPLNASVSYYFKGRKLKKDKFSELFPFASERPYIYVLKETGAMLNTSSYDSNDFIEDLTKLLSSYNFTSIDESRISHNKNAAIKSFTRQFINAIISDPDKFNLDELEDSLTYAVINTLSGVNAITIFNNHKIRFNYKLHAIKEGRALQFIRDTFVNEAKKIVSHIIPLIDIYQKNNGKELLTSEKMQLNNNIKKAFELEPEACNKISLMTIISANNNLFEINYLWKFTELLSNSKILKWASILKSLGYDGVIDENGIIYSDEHVQAVFFKKSAFKVIDKIRNDLYSPKRNFDTINYMVEKIIKLSNNDVRIMSLNGNDYNRFINKESPDYKKLSKITRLLMKITAGGRYKVKILTKKNMIFLQKLANFMKKEYINFDKNPKYTKTHLKDRFYINYRNKYKQIIELIASGNLTTTQ